MAKRDYLVEAAKQIHMALDSEVNEDYEAAFSYYKNGVDLLLNGVQLDPNKERREAVKRKTTQYLKRAEEIFITHLQDNLGKGSSHLGGYSSLRFRPIRHLSSPVEDLDMCKVVGVTDKVLIVQSMVNKETFVVKSLVKSSWESRDKPTIIPQGVPYMVKLLRYYVSEDAVYLHLEHVKGGKLFSKLHKLRNEKAKEHPECITSGQPSIKLKTSYTSPTISTDYQHNSRGSTGVIPEKLSDESPDTDFPTSWDETQQRLESCGTHSYIEETGCLQNTRSAASFYTKLDRLTLNSSLKRTQANTRIHTPAPSLCLHPSETQDQPSLPLSVLGSVKLWCHIRGRASWETNGSNQGSVLSGSSADTVSDLKQEHSSPTAEESNGMLVIKSTDRAVFSEHIDTSESSCHSSATLCHNIAEKQGTFLGETRSNDGVEEACEVLSHGEKVAPAKKRSFVSWFSTGPAEAPSHRNGEDVSVKSEGSGVQGEEDIIEVDGWCHTPRVPVETSRSADKAMHTCWGLSEAEVRVWGAQVLLALESLHQQGILCRDLNPRNVLLTSNGKVCLTFFGQWSEVQSEICSKAMEQMYCAPEIGGVSRITEACDWWSLGALLFELLTGMPLWQLHPAGIHSHTQLLIPNH
ncbi:Ribosomal protein S6 kinase-like 1 [Dissostichus eleginoides]|uniref:Ribosomal protein S6 kinase-like 1 n=1 Tax=Dissostichus eleginoides TaxID=100907 RepID=A0AAD9F9Y4_DISEL|nr:Ribosomal protein S6 kinase-like 1 [Dissostichus eleginoides]